MYTETLVAVGKEIGALAEDLAENPSAIALSSSQLQGLRVAYMDRLNVLQGHPPSKKSALSRTKEGAYEIIDATRGAAANAWQSTKVKGGQAYRNMKRREENDAENYLYF